MERPSRPASDAELRGEERLDGGAWVEEATRPAARPKGACWPWRQARARRTHVREDGWHPWMRAVRRAYRSSRAVGEIWRRLKNRGM